MTAGEWRWPRVLGEIALILGIAAGAAAIAVGLGWGPWRAGDQPRHARERSALERSGSATLAGAASRDLPTPAIGWIRPTELAAILRTATGAAGIVIIDARPLERFAAGHVPGAIQVPEAPWESAVRTLTARWQPELRWVVYCDGEACPAAERLAERMSDELGFTQVAVLRGGWQAWQAQSRTQDSAKPATAPTGSHQP